LPQYPLKHKKIAAALHEVRHEDVAQNVQLLQAGVSISARCKAFQKLNAWFKEQLYLPAGRQFSQ